MGEPAPFSPSPPPPIDLKVDIELTDGLTHIGTPSFYTSIGTGDRRVTSLAPGSATYHNGVFNIGTGKSKEDSESHSMTLPVQVSSSAVVNEQCLTATLTGNPPPGAGRLDDDISDNAATLCLGYQPIEPFVDGQVDVFTVYPCVGITTPPCDSTDDVRIRAVDRTAEQIINADDDVIIHIMDVPGRTYDEVVRNNVLQSVNSKDKVSWQTATEQDPDFVGTRRGVKIGFTRAPFNDHLSSWSTLKIKAAVEDADGSPPGTVHIRSSFSGNELFRLNSGTSWTDSRGPLNLSGPQNQTVIWLVEFEDLGTYTLEFSVEATHATETGDCDTDGDNANDAFCASETHTFHVGPMADLEVKAAPAADAMTAKDQVAFTVTATNHGPELRAPDVRVPVTLPAGMRFVRADSEDYDPQTGVWDIGELKHKEYRRSLLQSESETLTIVAELTGDVTGPVTGSIENHQDYCVRIVRIKTDDVGQRPNDLECVGTLPSGYTEHSAAYYDHLPDNNEIQLEVDLAAIIAGQSLPVVTGASIVSTPGAGDAYRQGETIAVAVTFNEAVRVQGTPMLALKIGANARQIPMASHRGDTLTFLYTVAAGDSDSDGVSVPRNGLTLPQGAAVTDVNGRIAAALAFAGLGNQSGHKVNAPVGAPEPDPPFYVDPPAAPEALTATPGDEEVTLQWASYCCDEKNIFYQLWRGDFPTWQDIAGSDRDTVQHTVTGLTNGESYRFRIRAVYRHRADDGTMIPHPGGTSRTAVATPQAPDTNRGPNSPPVFDRPDNEDFSVVERAPRGAHVATVRATDPDGDALTYTFQNAESESRFNIANVNGEGVITVAEEELSIPWEHRLSKFKIGVAVTDGRDGWDYRTIEVRLTASPLRDNAPEPVVIPDKPSISCATATNTSLAAGTAVAKVKGNDPEGEPLWYILVTSSEYFQLEDGTRTGDNHHPDPSWEGDSAKLIKDGKDGTVVVEIAKPLPESLCGEDIWMMVHVEEEDNSSNWHSVDFEVRVEPPSSSRSTGPGESGPSLTAAVKTWTGEVRSWWTDFVSQRFTELTFLSLRNLFFVANNGEVPQAAR